jgi:hypothetical protein
VILSKTGISTVPTSSITGNIAVSPITAAAITGFSLVADSTNVLSRSSQVIGEAFAANYAVPTPTTLIDAVSAMETAYTDAAGRDAGVGPNLNLLGGILYQTTLTPGVYTFGTDVTITSDITFNGPGVFIIQIAGNLVQDANFEVKLSGGALPENIFWQVAGVVEVGAGAHMEGTILAKVAVTFIDESSLNGRILSQTAVALQKARIVQPTGAAPVQAPTQAPEPVVSLGAAGSFAIISETAVGNTGYSAITGNVAVTAGAAFITGFELTGQNSALDDVTGTFHANDQVAIDAVADMNIAYNSAAERTNSRGGQPGAIVLGTTYGSALFPFEGGVYTFGAAVTNFGDIYFEGSSTDVFVIQITGAFAQAIDTKVILNGGALAENIFWQIGGAASLGAKAEMEGTILCFYAIAFGEDSHLTGRALARTAVTLGAGATISQP